MTQVISTIRFMNCFSTSDPDIPPRAARRSARRTKSQYRNHRIPSTELTLPAFFESSPDRSTNPVREPAGCRGIRLAKFIETMSVMSHDVRYAARVLSKNPGFTSWLWVEYDAGACVAPPNAGVTGRSATSSTSAEGLDASGAGD